MTQEGVDECSLEFVGGEVGLSWKCLVVLCWFKHQQDRHFPMRHRHVSDLPKKCQTTSKRNSTSKYALFFFVCAMCLSCYKKLKNALKNKK